MTSMTGMSRMYDVPEKWDMESDLVAMGASSGGLASVIRGHDLGLKTLLLEKSEYQTAEEPIWMLTWNCIMNVILHQ